MWRKFLFLLFAMIALKFAFVSKAFAAPLPGGAMTLLTADMPRNRPVIPYGTTVHVVTRMQQ